MNENNFWATVWMLVVIVFLGTVTSCVGYHKDRNTKIVQAIESGADPFAVVCAMGDSLGDNPTCIITAIKTK